MLHQHELKMSVNEGQSVDQEIVQRVLDRFLEKMEKTALFVPKWFLSRADVEYHSWTVARVENYSKLYHGT